MLSIGTERLGTRNPTSKLMLTILCGAATWERDNVLERPRDGIARAPGLGRSTGRQLTVAMRAERIKAVHTAGAKPAHIAKVLEAARSSVCRFLELGTVTA